MKKIVNSRLYDTETASLIGYYDNGLGAGDFRSCYEALYKKKKGEFFLYGSGGAMTAYAEPCGGGWSAGSTIIPLTEKEAKDWAERNITAEEYIAVFGAEE